MWDTGVLQSMGNGETMNAEARNTERNHYPAVKAWLETFLQERFATVHLEVTANKTFSNTLKAQIDRSRNLIFSFLREASPDLTGFVKRDTQWTCPHF